MSQLTFDQSFGSPAPIKNPAANPVEKKPSWYKGRVLSHSSISMYQTCPQKWKFRYIDKVPQLPKPYFSFGKSVHAGLEFLFSKANETFPTIEALITSYRNQWLSEGYETSAQEKWFFQEGERILKGFYIKHHHEYKNVHQVELKFTIDIDGVPMLGYIDRIDEIANGKLSIVDYKTGKAFDKSRVRKDPQLTLYQIAVREMLGKEVELLTLYHLNSLTPLTVPAHPLSQEQELRSVVVQVAQGISENKFDPKPDEKGHCQWCDYVQICPAFAGKKLPGFIKPVTQEPIGEMVDRYGKLALRLSELSKEKDIMEETLMAHLERLGVQKVEGSHFKVELSAGDEVTEPELQSTPLLKTETPQ